MNNTDADKLVLLARFQQNGEAELVASYLRSQGIECVLNDRISNQLLGGYIDIGGVQLEVFSGQLPQARQAMEEGGFEKYLV